MSEQENPSPAVHDRGGWPTDMPIDQGDHQWADWEYRIQGMSTVLRRKGLVAVDEMRRAIESIPAAEYEELSYFERWSASYETLLVEKEILTTEDIDQKAKQIEERWG